MARIIYTKPTLSFEEQVEKLKSRGLIINDEPRAKSYLERINYYRFSAYFLPYQSTKDCFNTNVTFDHILNTYAFDRELRLLVFDCIERIEIAIRTKIVYHMCHKYNSSHWQDMQSCFKQPYNNAIGKLVDVHDDFQKIIRSALNSQHPEVFIKHYKDNYHTPINPPAWMCFELLTIGELSRIYKGLNNNADKKIIANHFGLSHQIFTSWLHSLTYVRNICAHHSRLWNKELAISPERLNNPSLNWVSTQFNDNKRTFYFLCILKYLMQTANPSNTFTQKLDDLFVKYPLVNKGLLGIPTTNGTTLVDWKNEHLWKN